MEKTTSNIDFLFIRDKFEAPLSITIQIEYNKLISTLLKVPTQSRSIKTIDGTGGKVSITDLISYQIGWGKLLIGWYNSGIRGKMPQMPGEGFSHWNYIELAKLFYKKYHYDNGYKQHLIFHTIVRQILNIVEKEYQTNNLDKIGIFSWCTLPSGKQWSLRKWITINTSSPYRRASTLIKKILKS